MLRDANRLNNISERAIYDDNGDGGEDDADDVDTDFSTFGGAPYLNNNGNLHNDSFVDVLENDNNGSVSEENSTHSINLRQMHNDMNVQWQRQHQRQQEHIRQPQKRQQKYQENAADDEREYFIAMNSDALRMDADDRDENIRKIRSDGQNNPMNGSSAVYNDNGMADEMCVDSNSSKCDRSRDADNVTCVGDEAYCNYTYEEYLQMLHDYIKPSVPEWILICSHAIVFFIGLVSTTTQTADI